MKRIFKLLALLMLLPLFATAQVAVTQGNQITSESDLVSGNCYLIYYVGNGSSAYVKDTGSAYTGKSDNTATTAAVYIFTTGSTSGTWKIQNVYTGNYWGTPTADANTYIGAATGGDWALNFQDGGNVAPSCNGHSWNRSGNNIHPWSTGTANVNQFKIYEVDITSASLSSTAAFSDFTDNDISVSSTPASNLSMATWYVMSQRSRTSYVFENTSDHKLKHTLTKPSGSAETNANYLVRLLGADGGKYYVQNGLGNYMGVIAQSTNVPTTVLGSEAVTISKIANTDGHFSLQGTTNGIVLDANDFTAGDPSTVVGWGTSAPTTTGGNNDWAFYPVEFTPAWNPSTSDVYTINNTNSNRGAMMYAPSQSTTYMWSSGKNSQTFNASSANCQWVIIPTSTSGQYYLYNVGADKFAIPSGTGSTASWVFSYDAVPVVLISQTDGTKKIKTATTDTYAAVSNGFSGPIINYNDIGGNFTITKVDGANQSAAATTAVNRLLANQTALTSSPTGDGWYAIQIKSGTYAGKTVYAPETEIEYATNRNYPLTFTSDAVGKQPSIGNSIYYTRIAKTSSGYAWQLPNGRYLKTNSSNWFPTSTSETVENVSISYSGSGMQFAHSNYKAVPYYLNSKYFIGETSGTGGYFNVYPIDLSAAGLTAWKVLCDDAPETAQISCSRSDVSGLTSVYKNGYIFLPSSVTPASTDFSLSGATDVVVDATNKTVALTYNSNLALVEDGVTVAQGWQTAGRNSEVMLLRVNAAPFKDATNVTMSISLKDGAEANIATLKLYEANSDSPEIYSTGSGAPTKTEVATASISGSTATFNIGNFSAGTHYYWIGATVSSTATLGAVLDAAVTGITYTCNSNETTLDLTSVGDPADRGAMVFNTRSYPFLPRDNGSRVYRIPAMVVANDGSIVVAADKRYQSYTDIGGGHVIDIVVRRSTDGGKTWSAPVTIAKGEGSSNNDRCGFGDPSLVKGKDGKLYCLFAAGNLGYFYGQKHVCMSTSTDNGVTWSSSESNPPVDLYSTNAMKNSGPGVGNAGGYGLYDYFVTSGKGLYTSDGILMYLIPGQTLTSSNYNTLTDGTYWGASSDDYLFYSTDDGATWYLSDTPMIIGGDEAKIIEMNDGSLLGSIRKQSARRFNTASYTKNGDGTLSFTYGTQYDNGQLSQTHQNNQDLIYYQRGPKSGKTDVIIHSMTTGQHANLKLYYSLDQGANWTEFLNVQTKGTRYVTLERSGTDENPGSLYMLFEDQSLNSAGGYTDYNHYPLNFLEITREQLESLIPELNQSTVISDGKYYRIRNKNYGKYMVEKSTSHSIGCEDVNTTAFNDYTALWKVSVSGYDVKLQNAITDRYIQKQGYKNSVPYTTLTSESNFTLVPVDGEDNTFVIGDFFYSNENYNISMHCAASQNYNVVGWYTVDGGTSSQWIFEEVTPNDLILQVSRESYQNMQNMIDNADTYTAKLAKYFTDATCTEIKAAYTAVSDADLTNEMSADGLPLQIRNMAVKVKNNSWTTYAGWDKTERTFRVADYKAYSDYQRWTSILKQKYSLGRLTNPTGIRGSRDELISLYVGSIPAGQTVALEIVPLSEAASTQASLHEGFNAVALDNDCTLFLYHSVDNTTNGEAPFTPIANYAPVTVHIEGGSVQGYFDLTKGDTDEDWAMMKTHLLTGSITDLKTPQLTFHLPTAELKAAVGDNMAGLLNIWEGLMTMERNMQGLEEYDGYFNNPLSVTSPTTDYMHASDYGTYYADYTISSIMNYSNMKTNGGNIWGPAHEIGHIHQEPINMIGCTEISNNVFSNIAVFEQGRHTSRSASIQKTFDDFQNGKSWLDRVFSASEEKDLWQATHLYWQLYQYFHIAGYKTDFYPELYKAMRQSPMTHTGGVFVPASEDYLKFYKTCCEVSGYDLTEFFQVYGFFNVPTQSSYTIGGTTRDAHLVGDYGNYYVYTTQEMIDAAKNDVKAMKLKPCNILFIEDRIYAPDATYEGAAAGEKKISWDNTDTSMGRIGYCGETGQYSDFRTPISGEYTASVSGNTVTISGGTGAVGYKVYDAAGNLVLVANTHTFTLPDGLGDDFTIKVAQGDGSSATITPLYKNVQVSYVADGFFTTIYSPVALTIPAGARAFAGVVEGDVLRLRQYEGVIPAMQGAVIEFLENPITGAQASFLYDFTPTSETGTPIAGNRLTGSLVDADPRTFDGNVFTFAVKSGNLGFYKYTGSMLKAGKAFLLLNDNEANNIRGFELDFPTGVNSIGQFDNLQSDNCYDLQGRKLSNSKSSNSQLPKGIYIINGKKVLK